MSEIKDNWIQTKIGDQITLQRGFDITKAEQCDGFIPVISSSGVSSYHNIAKVNGPGVILGRKGVVGSVFYINEAFWPHDTTLWVKDFHENYPRFVYYFFKNHTKHLINMDVGSANPTLNRNHVHLNEVVWPECRIQKAIAHILGTLDDKIELNRRMNETLESIARAIFTSWFIDFDPVRAKAEGRQPEGMDASTAALFPSEFETVEGQDIPKGWQVKPIGEIVEVKGGSTPSTGNEAFWGGDIPFCTPKDLANNMVPFLLTTERKITELGVKEISSGVLPVGTVLLSSRAPIGYIAITTCPISVNQGFITIIQNESCINYYIYQWLKTNMDAIIGNANGTTFLEISKKNFRPLLAVLPNKQIMDAFKSVTESLFSKICSNLVQSSTLVNFRDTLLPKLLSGELQIDNPEAFLEATA